MRNITLPLVLLALACLAPVAAAASVVDAGAAEQAFQRGDYKAARQGFETAIDQFRTAPKDSADYRVYREAAYLWDRLADCAFTQRDWDKLKLCADGLLMVSVAERNLCESQLAGALQSGIAYASARYLALRLDESVRLASMFQLKRSAALVLFDAKGKGSAGEGAIVQYQALSALWRDVLSTEDGAYVLDVNALNAKLSDFDSVYASLSKLADLEALWEKYAGPANLHFSGTGSQHTQQFHLGSGLVQASYSHSGKANFIVSLLDSQGKLVEIIANEIGGVQGSKAFGVDAAGQYILSVDADGAWTVALTPPAPEGQN
jgi:hypothetical protein